ncbi:DUF4116 domain-containing protein [Candidatus Protochlamydia phocaeensis]|uniref:DUF4116 domain-containing protein n=1 Tax=Candidatus Protochlamydia phocaeensis TaxID=1414722 RepID=UPI0008392EE5|nr:DUF4116 domain-containing protein [Candidatus Protochlamydia phocaeensis]
MTSIIYQIPLPALFKKNENEKVQVPASNGDDYRLSSDLILHIFQFCKQTPSSLFPFLLTSKQWYAIAMSDPFIRLAQAVFKVNQSEFLKGEIKVNCSHIWPSSPMTDYEFQTLLELDRQKKCLETIFHFNLQLFSKTFKGYFHPLLHAVRWDPTHFSKSKDPEISALGLNHLAFYALMTCPTKQWRASLTNGTINWDELYGGACNPTTPDASLSQSAEVSLESLMAKLSASKEERPHILNILKLHGLAIQNAPKEIQADLEAAFIAVRQNGLALAYLDSTLPVYRNLVLIGVRQNSHAYNKLTNYLRYDIEVLAIALNQDLKILQRFSALEADITFYSLRQLAEDLSQINQDHLTSQEASKESLLQKCLQAITLLPSIAKIESQSLRLETIVTNAHRWSRIVLSYQNKLLSMYREQAGGPFERIVLNLKACLLTKPCLSFKDDLKYAVFGKFLHCANDEGIKKELEVISHDPEALTDEELTLHFKRLLTFFMENVELDPTTPACRDILKKLDSSTSIVNALDKMEAIYKDLETSLSKQIEQEKIALKKALSLSEEELNALAWQNVLTSHLKLWPLLKAFNRTILLDIHARIITLNRLLGDQQPLVKHNHELSDSTTKSIEFIFKDGQVFIRVKRLGYLRNYENCSILSNIFMRASIQDLSQWDVKAWVNISKPEEADSQFKKDYAKLIEILDIMKIPFEETAILN